MPLCDLIYRLGRRGEERKRRRVHSREIEKDRVYPSRALYIYTYTYEHISTYMYMHVCMYMPLSEIMHRLGRRAEVRNRPRILGS